MWQRGTHLGKDQVLDEKIVDSFGGEPRATPVEVERHLRRVDESGELACAHGIDVDKGESKGINGMGLPTLRR